MEQFILCPISLAELTTALSDLVDEKIKAHKTQDNPNPQENKDYLSRSEVSKQLKISFPTLSKLTLEGVIKGYRIGRRVLYKPSEVEAALHQIGANKYKRKDLR